MINYRNAHVVALSIHQIGSKSEDEGVMLSDKKVPITEYIEAVLLTYFFSQFQNPEFHSLSFTNGEIELNPLYNHATKIFENPDCLHESSIFFVKHLYEKSNHPNIKSGDFLVAYIKDILVDDEMVDAIVLCKSESKDDFLQLKQLKNNYEVHYDKGINVNKLDKSCIILNTEKITGYKLCVIDNSNKNNEAVYWKNEFLNVKPRADNYHATLNYIQMTKAFVKEKLKPLYEIDKTEEAIIMNKSKEFFKSKDEFIQHEYECNIFQNDDQKADFQDFKQDYQKERSIDLPTTFSISEEAFKKQLRTFKSILKLDKNFHIYIHGKRDLIEKGVDENGRKYYKIFYETES